MFLRAYFTAGNLPYELGTKASIITFPESDLLFYFPDDWVVRKYDDTAAYQSLSGHGLKGVDFIALAPDGKLWLVEVKNYRPRISTRNGKEYRANRPRPEELAEHVAVKFLDSQRLIRIVDSYLRKYWWRRLQLWWIGWRGKARTSSNYWFWSEAKRRCAQPAKVVFVLWMETPERKTSYDDVLEQLLLERMPAGDRVLVVEADRNQGLGFGVVPASVKNS
ncbi:MAG: hypothetical protein AAF840_03940 [Bacteroidota bacterium]